MDSYNGSRSAINNANQTTFLKWFASSAFGGMNYSNTPVGAISHVDEPWGLDDSYDFYRDWASGKSFAISAYHTFAVEGGIIQQESQAVGDPFVTK
ncbi:MAG: hypothetical protein ABSA83_18930 [Verrucomicrobiota bacterium]